MSARQKLGPESARLKEQGTNTEGLGLLTKALYQTYTYLMLATIVLSETAKGY